MTSILDRIFGKSSVQLARLKKEAQNVVAREPSTQKLSDAALPEKLSQLRAQAKSGTSLDALLPETFALVRETARRTLGEHPFLVQVMGGIALHRGTIAEMKTGEGKTLVATMPVALNALAGSSVHVVTVNEYLAQRDAQWMGTIYRALGLSVGVTLHGQSTEEKRAAYAADITYGTNNEFGFDYLRDNMAYRPEDRVQRGLDYVIVDEVDSILIDESRTPLIISAPDTEATKQYTEFARLVPRLERGTQYAVDEKQRAVTLTDEGISRMEELLGVTDLYGANEVRLIYHLEQALRSHVLYKRDVDYVVKEGEVIIVDSFTGRLMPGRRYSEGLHQAIEAKEGVRIQEESRTLATITFQNYFRLYEKISGMTGTAVTSREEFQKVYDLDVVTIPTNRPMVRTDRADRVYATEDAKFRAVIREVKERHAAGQPVLVGTIAIEKSERLSTLLRREGIPHEVLNAKNHEREAQIIAQAGQPHAVTISTNMAGRGTDIKLGDTVTDRGGLFVLGTERHEARRIDNQLRGRSGRQGDPGASQFFISFDDDIMRIFGGDRMKRMLERLQVPEDEPIESSMVSRAVEAAQAKVEGFYFDSRKHVLEYDDVMNKQRGSFYRTRRSVVDNEHDPARFRSLVVEVMTEALAATVDTARKVSPPEDLDTVSRQAVERFSNLTDVEWEPVRAALPTDAGDELPAPARAALAQLAERLWDRTTAALPDEAGLAVCRGIFLQTLDLLWTDHLDTMEYLRKGIGLRGYGQRDPLVEYRHEGHQLFRQLLAQFRQEATLAFLHLTVHSPRSVQEPARLAVPQATDERPAGAPAVPPARGGAAAGSALPHKTTVRRNDPCPCGSGKKYKKCHGARA